MKIALCAIAKCENDYIDEWVSHHIDLGFDQIFLYDNNDSDYEFVGDRITKYIDKVTIIPLQNKYGDGTQEKAYTECYQKESKNYDWFAFFDIDEFLFIDNGTTLKEKLSTITFDNVLIPWTIYTWSGKITRDLNTPVVEDFTQKISTASSVVKSIVRGNLPYMTKIDVHGQYNAKTYCDIDGNELKPTDIHSRNKNIFTRTSFSQFDNLGGCRTATLNHYWSKSLDEFIRFKCNRGYFNTEKLEKTARKILKFCNQEDQEFIKNYLNEHLFNGNEISF